MDTQPTANCCPKCHVPLPADAPQGLCPRCLLAAVAAPTEAGQSAGRPTPPALKEVAAAFPQLEILEFIGQGGMGFVFKARQPKLDRLVALKILPQSLAADPTFAERFNREARLLARLNHPGIVTVHDFGVAAGILPAVEPGFQPGGKGVESTAGWESTEAIASSDASPGGRMPPSTSGKMPDATSPVPRFYYLLMEFVDGVNLRQAMQAGRFTPEQALAIVPKICEALQFAHNEGILHRDIKPENILLDAKGRVKIADFGIAKLVGPVAQASLPAGDLGIPAQVDSDGSANWEQGCSQNPQAGKPAPQALTEAGKALGTPNYMAPEQLENAGEVDHRADIYSLGVVFYEMLTGELPRGQFPPPSQKSAADPRVDEVVLRALEKEKARRQTSAEEVRTQVETIVTGRRPVDESQTEIGSTRSDGLKPFRLAWTVGLLVWALVLSADAITTFLLPKAYLATTRLKLNQLEDSVVTDARSVDPYSLQTQFEYIKANEVLSRVVGSENLTDVWGRKYNAGTPLETSKAVELLRQGLYIRPVRGTSFIELGSYSDNPQVAAQLANAVATAYVGFYTNLRAAKFQARLKELEQKLKVTDSQVGALREQLAKLQSELGIPDAVASKREEPASIPHEQAGYWKKKRTLDQQLGLRNILEARITMEKLDYAMETSRNPIVITDTAVAPTKPTKPNIPLNLVFGALVGAAAGLLAGLAVLRFGNSRQMKDRPLDNLSPRSSRRESAQTETAEGENQESGTDQSLLTSSPTSESRFPRKAIVGACLIPLTALIPMMVWWMRFPIKADREKFGLLLAGLFLLIGISAPFATTILGWMAVSQIRRSAGTIHGLWLALVDGLLFPLLALMGLSVVMAAKASGLLVEWLTSSVLGPVADDRALFVKRFGNFLAYHPGVPPFVGACLGAVVGVFIIRRVWRAVNPPQAATANRPRTSPGRLAWALGLLIVVAIAGAVVGQKLFGGVKITHITPQEFQRNYTWPMNSMSDAEYLGMLDGKAFMRLREVSTVNSGKWSERVVYVNLSELDPAFRENLPAIAWQPKAQGVPPSGRTNSPGVKMPYKLVQAGNAECSIEREHLPETTAGLQEFRWNYSIPANHVATFRFIVTTNGQPQIVHGLTLWYAAGTNDPAKGYVQWSRQDGLTLSPELDKQERWDLKVGPATGGGMGGSVWMNKEWRDGHLTFGDSFKISSGDAQDIWVHFRRAPEKRQFASNAEMYGTNFVLMQVSLEALPPGMHAGATGFGASGTNWAALLPKVFKTNPSPSAQVEILDAVPGVNPVPQQAIWGEPTNGVSVSLRADKSVWSSDEPPILRASLRNESDTILETGRTDSHLQQIEVDGKWYRSRVTYYEGTDNNGQEVISRRGGSTRQMHPGEQWDDVQISLRPGDWQRATTNDLALTTYPFRNWVTTDTGIAPVLSLAPGKHTVRVAFVVAMRAFDAFRVISNPVELEIERRSSTMVFSSADGKVVLETTNSTLTADRIELHGTNLLKAINQRLVIRSNSPPTR